MKAKIKDYWIAVDMDENAFLFDEEPFFISSGFLHECDLNYFDIDIDIAEKFRIFPGEKKKVKLTIEVDK